MKEYVIRLTVKGINYKVDGETEIDALINFFAKYKKFSDERENVKICQRNFFKGELSEIFIRQGVQEVVQHPRTNFINSTGGVK